MSRAREFRTRWRGLVWRTSLISDGTRVFLLALAEEMAENGYVSVPRSTLAAKLGRSEKAIKDRVAAAVEAGLLARVSPGRRGHTAVYRASLPDQIGVRKLGPYAGSESRTPTEPVSGYPGGPTTTRADPFVDGSDRLVSSDGEDVLRGERSEPAEGRMMNGFEDEFIGSAQRFSATTVGLQLVTTEASTDIPQKSISREHAS